MLEGMDTSKPNGLASAHAKDATNVSTQEVTNGHATWNLIDESCKLLQAGILDNPLINKSLPKDAAIYASKVKFTGHTYPAIPIPWRFAESVSTLKALEAIMVGGLLKAKYGVEPQDVEINIDHAQLFVMSAMLTGILIDGVAIKALSPDPAVTKLFPSGDIHRAGASPHRTCATNIYRTKDERFFHLHGSMNPSIIMQAIGMPEDMEGGFEEAALRYQEKVKAYTAQQLQHIASVETKQAGTICWSIDEFKASEHGKANAHVGLWETHHHANPAQKAGWWADSPQTSPARPLAGLKIVDLTRIIAAPAVTRGLAELGASVMRITAPHLQDMGGLHPDLGWGKWNCSLDLRKPEDLEKAKALIMEADVVVSGYRPAVLDKYGLGETGILELTKNRDRGIIFARENCYGWNGPWQGRSGWQQISDACCGVSLEFGRAMGNEEAVTPVFPNSDYCTGIAGASGILDALMQRAEKGGSYTVDVALNYYSQWLVNSVGMYPKDVWEDVWQKNGRKVMRHYYPMGRLLPLYFEMLAGSSPYLFSEEFFEVREAKAVGTKVRTVKPILQWKSGVVKPGFQVSARRNGIDQPRWPEDLMVELVE
jgi:crotonobetainyl-CoA:carnitine CoA-transferase CaiB-like acyl-CoA transferase